LLRYAVQGIHITQITKGTDVGDRYFETVPKAMNSLMLDGMFPMQAAFVNDLASSSPFFWPMVMIFIILASVTVMNMLVGVLVEVVRTVAATEKERLTVQMVSRQLRAVLREFSTPDAEKSMIGTKSWVRPSRFAKTSTEDEDSAENPLLPRSDFHGFLLKSDVALTLQDIGVDCVSLMDMTDQIYEEHDKEGTGLSFENFIEVVLNMRGNNPSTVKDIKGVSTVMKTVVKEATHTLRKSVTEDLDSLRVEVLEHLIDIRRNVGSDAGSDFDDKAAMLHAGSLSSRFHAADKDDDDDDDVIPARGTGADLTAERSIHSDLLLDYED